MRSYVGFGLLASSRRPSACKHVYRERTQDVGTAMAYQATTSLCYNAKQGRVSGRSLILLLVANIQLVRNPP